MNPKRGLLHRNPHAIAVVTERRLSCPKVKWNSMRIV
jgi:hypothetical protein